MDEADALSAVIEHIYEAALNSALWPHALKEITDFVGGYSGAIFSKNASRIQGEVFHHDGVITDEYREIYFTTYIKLDPANTVHFFAELEKPVAVSSMVAMEDFVESRFFREWAAPQGLVDFATVALERSAATIAHLGVFRHESRGPADDMMLRRMRLLAPHVRRAVMIGRAFELKTAESSALADTLDGLTGAFLLVDRNARILHGNATAHRELERQGVFQAPEGRLVFQDRAADQTMRALIERAAGDEPDLDQADFIVPIERRDGERFVAHVLPLSTRSGRARSQYAAIAAIYVQRAVLELATAPTIIARTYALTPTELRVLMALVEIGGVPETAESLGIAETTVKTHLRRIFSKTGTNRQADLVKLMASYVLPVTQMPPALARN